MVHYRLEDAAWNGGLRMYQVYFVRERKQVEVPEGTTILEAERLAGLLPDAPCGGAGTCGKCLVIINGQ